MKILIVTQQDPFYLPVFFESFFDGLFRTLKDIDITGVVLQLPLGQRSKKALLRRMIDFYGPVVFTLISLRYALRQLADGLNRLGLLPTAYSIASLCRSQGVRVLPHRNVNHPSFVEFVRNNKVDLIISVAAAQIFKSDILKAPRLGCINIHNAPLPQYRGMMPSFWQVYQGEKHVVATVHEMVQEIDKGRIILQARTEISKGMTLDALIKKTRKVDALALLNVLRMFRDGQVKYHPLPKIKGSYYSFPSRRDVLEFKRKGNRII